MEIKNETMQELIEQYLKLQKENEKLKQELLMYQKECAGLYNERLELYERLKKGE